MAKISQKIALPIILAGLFVMVIFVSVYYDSLNTNFYIVVIPLIVFLFLFGFAIGQKFASPVKKLLKGADYLSKGSSDASFYLDNKDELGELSKTFNKIAEKLGEHKSHIETLNERLKVRTRALEEIINVLEQKVKNRTLELNQTNEEMENLHLELREKNKEITQMKNKIQKKTKKRYAP